MLIIAISLISFANAVPDSVIVGPYKVSFDIGMPGVDYRVNIFPPSFSEALNGDKRTTYIVDFNNTTTERFAGISIMVTNGSRAVYDWKNVPEWKRYTTLPSGYSGTDTAERIIDNIPGMIIKGQDYSDRSNVYVAAYQLPAENNTIVILMSWWPWYPDTTNLLNTIHVERVK